MLRNISQKLSRKTLILHPRTFAKYSSKPTEPPHSTDSYAKDVDGTPPQDHTVHRVDPTSDTAQKPHEPPSGEFSRAGTKTEEYAHVDTQERPYGVPGNPGQRYGGKEAYEKEKGSETSHPGEGPDGKSAGGIGRK